MSVVAFSVCGKYSSGSIGLKDKLARYNQGDKLTLRSIEYPGLQYSVQLMDVFMGTVRITPLVAHARTRERRNNVPMQESAFFFPLGRYVSIF